MQKPINVANYFLKKYGQDSDITPMKLVKLVYISHGWYLGITGVPLLDENSEAWQFGPVIPSIYHNYKSFGRNPIKMNIFIPDPYEVILDETQEFLDKIWAVYGGFSAIELSQKTHEFGTPWHMTWRELKAQRSGLTGLYAAQIPDTLIKAYYEGRINANRELETA